MIAVPDVVRAKALLNDAEEWLEALPSLVESLAAEWSFRVVRSLEGGTESFVCEAELADGQSAVLKLLIPRDPHAAHNEITALLLADGEGCARLIAHDVNRRAMLLERLGRPMVELGLPLDTRQRLLCAAASRVWRPAPDAYLPSGAVKASWLADYIPQAWSRFDAPCSERTVDHALRCLERRVAAHRQERAVLVHGDVHQWNALEAGDGFKLVDPDGVVAEAEYDLGVMMREDPEDLLDGGSWERAHALAAATGLDATAIWQWGVAERVSTGLLCTEVELQPVGRLMLEVADRISADRAAGDNEDDP